MNRTIEYKITEAQNGLRVEQFLRRKGYSGQNLAEIKRMPKSVLVNGKHYYMRQTLKTGDDLVIKICETACSEKIPPVYHPLDIVYEDEDIVVINKAAGMPIHPSLNHYTESMANALAWYYQEQGKPFIFRCCNRLDRDTSGLTVVAKHLVSGSILSTMVKERRIHREYLAICKGSVTPSEGTINAPLGRKPGTIIERTVDFENGEKAITHYHVMDEKTGTALSPSVWRQAAPIRSGSTCATLVFHSLAIICIIPTWNILQDRLFILTNCLLHIRSPVRQWNLPHRFLMIWHRYFSKLLCHL